MLPAEHKSVIHREQVPVVWLTATKEGLSKKKELLDYQSASELYRPRSRCLSQKLVLTFAGRGVSRGQNNESLRPLISVF
jgi:hypothetical protein